jgi:hypothetical protein
MTNFLSHLHEWQSLIGTLINLVVVTSVAILVTNALTASAKRTEFFLNFTKRYQEIRVAAHDLDKKLKTNPGSIDEGDAREIYFQLFGLTYDEINAYRNNFLDKNTLVDWLTWQMYDYMGGEFKIGGVSFDEGWQWWLSTPAKYHEYTPMLKKIFACRDKECVKNVIERQMAVYKWWKL